VRDLTSSRGASWATGNGRVAAKLQWQQFENTIVLTTPCG